MVGRWPWALTLGAYLGLAVLFFTHSEHARLDFPLDDAWIHRVYARAMALGQGLAYNPGQQETGATSPLWAAVTAPAHWLAPLGPAAPVLAVKLIGVLCGGLAVVALCRVLAAIGLPGPAVAAGGLVLALEPRLHFSALSGMEVVLAVWLWLELTRLVVRGSARPALLLAGLLPLARPEAALVVPYALLALAAVIRRDGARRPPWWSFLPVAVPTAAWALFCRAVSGHWLPATFYVKSQGFGLDPQRVTLAWQAVAQHGWATQLIFPIGLVAAAAWLALRRTGASLALFLLLLAAPVTYLLGVVGTRAVDLVGYYWSRWTDPASLILTAAAGLGVAALVAAVPKWRQLRHLVSGSIDPRQGLRAVGPVIALLGLVLALPGLVGSIAERRQQLSSDGRAIRLVNVEPALWIRDNTPPDAVVGVIDAGASRYFGERHTIDMVGLNNSALVFGRTDPNALLARMDWLVAFREVIEQPGLAALFETQRVFGVPEDEYTVCPCPDQARNFVARRRAP